MTKKDKNLSSFSARLARYSALAGAALAAGTSADAAIVYRDIADTTINSNGAAIDIDFDSNSPNELQIKFNKTVQTCATTLGGSCAGSGGSCHCNGVNMESVYAQNAGTYAKFVGAGGIASVLDSGVTISAANTWFDNAGKGLLRKDNPASGAWNSQADKYLGVKFKIGGNTHYGWVRLTVSGDVTSATVKDYAYESTPDTAIIAGASNNAPVLDNSGTMTITSITEDATAPAGDTVAAVIASAGGDRITDVNSGAVEGLAVTGVTGDGTWQYNSGGGWTDVGAVSVTSALLLKDTSSIRFIPTPGNNNAQTATITFRAWDRSSGVEGTKVDASSNGGITAFSTATESASLAVTAVNDAPLLDNSGTMTLISITEDATAPAGDTVSAIIASASGNRITDADSGSVEGIAVTGVTGDGTWQYNTGGGWTDIGIVSGTSALLLADTSSIRFIPTLGNNNAQIATITFRAWDTSSGVEGTNVDASANGGTTAFSTSTETASIAVTAVNDAPVLDNSGTMTLTSITEDATAPAGDTVSAIILSAGGNRITDADSGSVEGIAVTGVTGDGTWQYNSGGGWTDVGAVGVTSALPLADTSSIRFIPTLGNNNAQTATITFRAWDRSSGDEGTKVNASANGGTTAFSTATESASLAVTAVNDAPVIDNSGTMILTSITEDATAPAGDTVAAIIASAGGNRITDVDSGSVEGIAVTGVTGDGTWQYNTGGGWTNIGAVAGTSALLLADTSSIRFVPTPGNNNAQTATITFKAWDRSSGGEGTKVDTGVTTAFSSVFETADLAVTALNDAPTIGTNTGITLNEGATATITSAHLNEGDPDDSGSGLTYTVTAVPVNGDLKISGTPLANNGTFTQDDIDNSRLSYTHDGSETINDSFTFSLADGGEDGVAVLSGQTFTITVTPQNDAPVISSLNADNPSCVIAVGSTNFDKNRDATLADSDSADFDSGLLVITQTAGTANGNFSLDGNSVTSGGDGVIAAGETVAVGGTSVGIIDGVNDGQGGHNLTIELNANTTPARVTELIRNLLYASPAVPGDRTFSVTVSDGDGATSAASTVVISAVINNAPTASNNTINMDENSAHVFVVSEFNFTDLDAGDTLGQIRVSSLPAAGSLALSGTGVSLNQVISEADITAGNLRFTPVANAFASPYASFDFQVHDGKQYSGSSYTMTINVNDVVPPPPPPSQPDPEVNHNGQTIGSGTTLPNNSNHTGVSVAEGGTVDNKATLTDLANKGTVTGGTISGNSTNEGLLNNVNISSGTVLNNSGGIISGSVNAGSIFGGSISGILTNNGKISGLAPNGTSDPEYSITISSGATVSGGQINGAVTNMGTLTNITIDPGTRISFTDGSGAQPGRLTGNITFSDESGTGCVISIPSNVVFPKPESIPEGGLVLTPQMLLEYATEHGWDIASRTRSASRSGNVIPEIPSDYLLAGGIVLSETGSRSSSMISVSIPYDASKIPTGYGSNDLTVIVYDYSVREWITVPSSRSGDTALKISTDLLTAYAVVVKTSAISVPGSVLVGQISGNTSEEGAKATFTVALGSMPSSDVTISIESSDLTEGTVSPLSITFTPENWNTARTVTVTGVDDDVIDGNQNYFVFIGPSVSDDLSYKGIDPSDISLSNEDNDVEAVFIPTQLSPENDANEVSLAPVIKMNEPGFIKDFGSHSKTQWQVSRTSDFAPFDLVFSITESASLYSVKVPNLALYPGKTYFWRARFIDNNGSETEWSKSFRFSTVAINQDDTDNDGVSDSYEIDMDTDLDSNGTNDLGQSDMLRTKSASGEVMIGVKKSENVLSVESTMALPESSIPAEKERPSELPLGALDIRIKIDQPGAEAEAVFYSSKALDKASGWYSYQTLSGWSDYINHASFSGDGKFITLKFKDGGYGDDDGSANGIIIHRAALPKPATAVIEPDTKSDGGGSCFIDAAEGKQSGFLLGLLAVFTTILSFSGTLLKKWRVKKSKDCADI